MQEWLSPDMPSPQSDFSFSLALPLLLGHLQNCNWTANVNTTDTKEKHMDAAPAGRVSVFCSNLIWILNGATSYTRRSNTGLHFSTVRSLLSLLRRARCSFLAKPSKFPTYPEKEDHD